MRSPVAMCQVNDTLSVAARRLWNHGCTSLPVVREDGKLVGMIDDRAICMAALSHELPLEQLLVNVAMSMEAFSVRPDQDLEVAEELMAAHHVAQLPVVDDDGKPRGMISLSEIALESARPDALIRDGFARVGRVLAAIAAHRRDQAA